MLFLPSLQQNEIIRWRNARFSRLFLRLPPPSADVGDFENLVLRETDLVRVVGVCFVGVDGLGAVGEIRWRVDFCAGLFEFGPAVRGHGVVGRAEARLRGVAVFLAGETAVVAGYRRRGLEAAELSGCVHLRRRVRNRGAGARAKVVRHWSAVACRVALVFVQGEGVNVSAVRRLRSRPEVEDPDDLRRQQSESGSQSIELTETMDNKMKPAAAASLEPCES